MQANEMVPKREKKVAISLPLIKPDPMITLTIVKVDIMTVIFIYYVMLKFYCHKILINSVEFVC